MSKQRRKKKKRNRKYDHYQDRRQVQQTVKDRLFRYLFEKDRKALLNLYNALNGTDYQDASQLEIVTIESAVYVVMKNDLAFVLAGTLNMYEHQSTYSPNLPVRFLIYLAQEYQMVIEEAEKSLYGTSRISLPTPQCVVFYNGTKEMPEEALAEAVDYCIEKGILEEFLRKNRAEVLGMLLEEFDVKKYERTLRSEGFEEGREEGIKLGRKQEKELGIRLMLEILKESDFSREYARRKLQEKFALSEAEAEQMLSRYWK